MVYRTSRVEFRRIVDKTEGMTSIEHLKTEIERLNKELQQASCDKVRAAEYGLAVLEEKQTLQEHYDELESQFESKTHELESIREV